MKARVLHPSFFTDEKVRQLSPNGKLLWQGLWCRADDHGRGVYLPKAIEGDVFPTEQVDIHALLNEIRQLGLIRTYEAGGQMYYDVPNWVKWQNPKYQAKSKLPEFRDDLEKLSDETGTIQGQVVEKQSVVSVSVSELEKVSEQVRRRRWDKFREQLSTGDP